MAPVGRGDALGGAERGQPRGPHGVHREAPAPLDRPLDGDRRVRGLPPACEDGAMVMAMMRFNQFQPGLEPKEMAARYQATLDLADYGERNGF